MGKVRIMAVMSLVFALGLAPQSFADDQDRQRIEDLERKVAELTATVNRLSSQQAAAPAAATTAAQLEESAVVKEEELASPKLNIRGFGHLQYDFSKAQNSDNTVDETNHFTNGGVDLFITSKVAKKISFLNETVFEFGTNGTNTLDVERVLLKYELSDKLNIALGRGHTALGYWNEHFHHGTWLQTTTGRPTIYKFEDDGGILPVHYVGLEFSGILDAPGGTVSYVSNVANGRGTIGDEVKLVEDNNDSKMVGLMFTYEPAAILGLGLGLNVITDKIPAKAGTADRGDEIDETISGAHIFYVQDPWEILLEAQNVNHFNHATDLRDESVGGYGQLGYKIGKYKPYFRHDWLRVSDRDPFFEGLVEDESSNTLGLRYELSTFNALKFEYRHIDQDNAQKNEATVQSSFAF